ncbi:PREDICTED: A-kinase-interacting protein 1-like [Elephantulus edwardii]|uniref:A-kinase-interacting protein 1-like n=1 Tax=Elephantulus edwardii TaxID=28737 RepID=UPI0003F0F24A|nr:PREDICTED: A-kinase-interacting protein 1-like [Elephantulus edwardii]
MDLILQDLYIEVSPGTYSVTVGSNDLTKKTFVIAVDSGQGVDLGLAYMILTITWASHHLFLISQKNEALYDSLNIYTLIL